MEPIPPEWTLMIASNHSKWIHFLGLNHILEKLAETTETFCVLFEDCWKIGNALADILVDLICQGAENVTGEAETPLTPGCQPGSHQDGFPECTARDAAPQHRPADTLGRPRRTAGSPPRADLSEPRFWECLVMMWKSWNKAPHLKTSGYSTAHITFVLYYNSKSHRYLLQHNWNGGIIKPRHSVENHLKWIGKKRPL